MIGVAQLLKSCAENEYAEKFLNEIENKLDKSVFNISTYSLNISQEEHLSSKHHHGPKVMASNPSDTELNLDVMIQEH